MLRQKSRCDFRINLLLCHDFSIFNMCRKISAITQMAAATNHRKINASTPTFNDHCDDIDIALVASFHTLLMQYFG